MLRLFIDRPRLSLVISLVVLLLGLVALRGLPIEKFPNLSPPVVVVSAYYPGADAEVVEQTVTALIEQELNGVPGMIAIDSLSADDGSAKVSVTFEIGSDIDQKSVLVQNRVQKAEARLPEAVRREGVLVEAASPNILAIVTITADDEARYDELFLNNYALLNIQGALARVPGVGRVELLGAREYGMRVWLNADRMRAFGLSANEVAAAIRAENLRLAGGRIGTAPASESQPFQFSVVMPEQLQTVEEFGAIRVRHEAGGSAIRLRDIADIELGAQNYDVRARLDGLPAASLVAYQLPGSNALEASQAIEAEMNRLAASFPEGLSWNISYDSTEVIEASVAEMKTTLYIAVGLVIAVVFVFLGGLRPTLVPAIAVPVSLIGSFALMSALGFSLNTLSLFGLILAIGIVVDDAILVVETTTRNIEERGMEPKPAAIAAMQEVGGAVIASTLVLLAVFIPVAFIPGLTGRLFQQFALTIAAAVSISTLNALTLSPALASLVLARPGSEPTRLARGFNALFVPLRRRYLGVVRWTLARKAVVPLALLALCAGTGVLTRFVPTGFVPSEDDGMLMMQVSLPDAASTRRTGEVSDRVSELVAAQAGVSSVISFSGFDLLTGAVAPNKATLIVVLDHWDARSDPRLAIAAVKGRIDAEMATLSEAIVLSFQPPPISGLGMTAGVDFELQDRQGTGATTLAAVSADLARSAATHPAIAYAFSSFRAEIPQVRMVLDRDQAARLGLALESIQDTLASNLAPRYVDDFVLFGRSFRVMMSGQRGRIETPEQLLELSARTGDGATVPLGTVADIELSAGPSFVTRYNLYPSSRITAVPAPGSSMGDAIAAMEAIAAASLGPEFGYDWSGQAREQREAEGASLLVFALSLVFVFLFLTAQYESFTTPIAVLLMVPLAAFGALLAVLLAGLTLDLYTQIGLVLLVGLTAKTAILLVELTKQQIEAGQPPEQAAATAAELRFRAVLMTAGTFILGMVPLLTASGAGAASRVSLGTAVVGGTLAGVVFTLLLVPRLYVLIYELVARLTGKRSADPPLPQSQR